MFEMQESLAEEGTQSATAVQCVIDPVQYFFVANVTSLWCDGAYWGHADETQGVI